jgi:3-dehydroquinate synthase
MPDYIEMLRKVGATRQSHVVAVGGGIIQDISTFLTSIYMRGLSWTYLPTTVLAMADSCIGGKSSINVRSYKNLVGNFYPPQKIVVDPEFVTTLGLEMTLGGLFEAGKICYAFGAEKFDAYLALAPEIARTPAAVEPIVEFALRTKKWFIEIDEFDRKERLLLNFGHTFGHAIESATHFGVSHGVGVGIGMAIACAYARTMTAFTPKGAALVGKLESHVRAMLATLDTDPAFVKPLVDVAVAMEKFEYDKKHRADCYRVVTPAADGALALIAIPRDNATRAGLERAFRDTLASLGWPVA